MGGPGAPADGALVRQIDIVPDVDGHGRPQLPAWSDGIIINQFKPADKIDQVKD